MISFVELYSLFVLLPDAPTREIISTPSSRFQEISGFGKPRALHTSFADPPSGTIRSFEVSSDIMSGGITTSRNALCKFNARMNQWLRSAIVRNSITRKENDLSGGSKVESTKKYVLQLYAVKILKHFGISPIFFKFCKKYI